MLRSRVLLAAGCGGLISLLAMCVSPVEASAAGMAPSHSTTPHAPQSFAFEPNHGQTDARAKFLAHSGGIDLYLTEAGALLSMVQPPAPAPDPDRAQRGDTPWQVDYFAHPSADSPAPSSGPRQALALRYGFAGANLHPRIEGLDRLPGRNNYLMGNDPTQWRTGIATYRRVRYHDVYPGVDVVYYGKEGRLEFDVEIAPGADLAQVRLQVDGADALALNADGDLRVHTALGDLVQHRPVVYQMIAGERRELRSDYMLDHAANTVAFNVPAYDHKVALVLDPTLVWTSQVGGSASDANNGVAVDVNGNWYFAGYGDYSATMNFPTTVGAYQTTNNGGSDAFVRKVSNDGTTVLYSTLIGGSGNDTAYGIGVDAAGIAYIAGTTYSSNLPTQNALQSTNPNGTSASGFVAALNAAGNGLVYSTYLGGVTASVPYTYVNGIAVDALGNAYVTGETTTTDLPTTPTAFQPHPETSGNTSAFVFKFDSSGALVFGTYLVDDYFGFGGDHGTKIAVDDDGNAYIVGYTGSQFGGTYNGVPRTLIGPGGGSYDMLVARLNHTGQWLDWVTHIGGSSIDKGTAIAVDAGHQVMVAGWSASSDLPPAFVNNDDWGWIGQLDQTGTQLVDSTWIGAAGAATFPEAIIWDELIVVGSVQKPSALPATNAVAGLDCGAQCGGNSSYGGFLALLTTGQLTLQSLTRVLGATGFDTRFHGVAQDPSSATGRTAVAGGSNGTFPGTTPGDTAQGAAAAVVDTRSSGSLPPAVGKRIYPQRLEYNEKAEVVILLKNPKGSSTTITELDVDDYLPACLEFVSLRLVDDARFGFDYNQTTRRVLIFLKPGKTFAPGDFAYVKFDVKAVISQGLCTNTISSVSSDAGTSPPASATVVIEQNPCTAVSTGACTSMNMTDAACWNGNMTPTSTCNATIAPCTGACSVNYDQPASQKLDRFACGGSCNVTGNDLLLGGGLACDNGSTCSVGAKVTAAAATLAVTATSTSGNQVPNGFVPERLSAATAAGNLTLSNGLALNGTDAFFDGDATVTVSGAISGTGNMNIFGPGNVVVGVSPTFAGSFLVAGGTVFANAAIAQQISLQGTGALRGNGPFGSLSLDDRALFFPGTTSAPVTVSAGAMIIDAGRVEFGFSSGNAAHSVINATGTVPISGGTLKLDFAAAPAINTTFSGLINSAGGNITGCFARAIAAQPNLILQPLCTAIAVSAKVIGNDRVFADGLEY